MLVETGSVAGLLASTSDHHSLRHPYQQPYAETDLGHGGHIGSGSSSSGSGTSAPYQDSVRMSSRCSSVELAGPGSADIQQTYMHRDLWGADRPYGSRQTPPLRKGRSLDSPASCHSDPVVSGQSPSHTYHSGCAGYHNIGTRNDRSYSPGTDQGLTRIVNGYPELNLSRSFDHSYSRAFRLNKPSPQQNNNNSYCIDRDRAGQVLLERTHAVDIGEYTKEKYLELKNNNTVEYHSRNMGLNGLKQPCQDSRKPRDSTDRSSSGFVCKYLESNGWQEEDSGIESDRARSLEAFNLRALSEDFGYSKPPRFPCHLAALGEGCDSAPCSPVKRPHSIWGNSSGSGNSPPNGVKHSLHHSAPTTPVDSAPRKAHAGKSPLHAISELFRPTSKKAPPHRKGLPKARPKALGDLRRARSEPNKLDQLSDEDDDNDDDDDDDGVNIHKGDDCGFLSHPSFQNTHAPSLATNNNSTHNISHHHQHYHHQHHQNHHHDRSHKPRTDDVFSHPAFPSAAAMQKAKSPSQARRILPKRWRKSKTGSSAKPGPCAWRPEGSCTWTSVSGRHVTLTPTSLLSLTELERLALQKIVLARLQALELGCSITIPKAWTGGQKRSKRSAFLLRRKTASSSFLDGLKDKAKDKDKELGSGWVFGLPLGKCIANDLELRRRKPSLLRERRESLDIPVHTPRQTRKSSSSSVSRESRARRSRSLAICDCGRLDVVHSPSYHYSNYHYSDGGAISSDSTSESETRGQGSNLLEALSLSSSAKLEVGRRDTCDPFKVATHTPQVPYIVNTCCKHLETYGLNILGIFRIGSSKKRAKQLREEFDTGRDVKLNEEHNPHDVGALLKEYFRDLPDPLLTKDLYSAFVATRKIKDDETRLRALHLLLALLPAPNRDTLWTLLNFLSVVAQHSLDAIDPSGQTIPGNKMDMHNLATLFGPNILHKCKSGEFQVESMERAEERKEVIAVVKELIDKQNHIFELSAEMQDDTMRVLMGASPESLDVLLKHKVALALGIEPDGDTSTSSYCQESDASSSIPPSPSYSSETDSGHPHSLNEALQMQGQGHGGVHPVATAAYPGQVAPLHRPAARVQSADSPLLPSKNTLFKVPVGQRKSAPEQGQWYSPERSKSPPSSRVSPSPKIMKPTTPRISVRITGAESPQTPKKTIPTSAQALLSPLSSRVRRAVGVPHGPGPRSPQKQNKVQSSASKTQPSKNMLSVPSSRTRSTDSTSSYSSGYNAGSSRSGTNSPVSPEGPPPSAVSKWYLETKQESQNDDDLSPLHRTSSTHRPLGFTAPNSASTAPSQPASSAPSSSVPSSPQVDNRPGKPTSQKVNLPEWQTQRWQHWESIARQHTDEFHEQETLV